MELCYFCEKRESVGKRLDEHACSHCLDCEITTVHKSKKELTNKQKAKQQKVLMQMFDDLFGEERE